MNVDELFSLACEHWDNEEYEEAIKWYKMAAEQGDADAQFILGDCYESGNGVEQSYREAFKWYKMAAEQENANPKISAEAQYFVGESYEIGDAVEQSYNEAVKWYMKAADQDHAAAQVRLGLCYIMGKGISQSYEEAARLFKYVAEKDGEIAQSTAQFNLGLCYEKGNGVEQSYIEAVKWYRKAAEQGNTSAQCNLADCYEKGNGVPKDYKKALELYNLAFENGEEDVKEDIDRVTAILNGGNTPTTTHSDNEQEYIETLKEIIAEDGEITDKEQRRLLEKLSTKLGISESRAKELEDALANPSLTAEEQEYLDEYKSIAVEGEISDKERKLLDKIRKMAGISEERAREIEKMA